MPLAPTLRTKLATAGFRTAADLEGIGPADLARGSTSHALQKKSSDNSVWHFLAMSCPRPAFGASSTLRRVRVSTAEAELSHEDALLALRAAGIGLQNGGLAGALCEQTESAQTDSLKLNIKMRRQ